MDEHSQPEGGGVEQGPIEVVNIDDFERRSINLAEARQAARLESESTVENRAQQVLRMRLPEAPAGDASKANVQRRALARLIDTVIFVLLAESIAFVGPLAALAYLLLGDGLIDGASIGKRLTGLHTQRSRDGAAGSIFDSLLRNAPFGIAGLFVLIPLIGWALFLTLGLAVVLFESYMVWHDPRGVRAGDILAGTQVRDGHAPAKTTPLTADARVAEVTSTRDPVSCVEDSENGGPKDGETPDDNGA